MITKKSLKEIIISLQLSNRNSDEFRKSFTELLDIVGKRMYDYCLRIVEHGFTKGSQLEDDIVQETCIRLIQHLPAFKISEDVLKDESLLRSQILKYIYLTSRSVYWGYHKKISRLSLVDDYSQLDEFYNFKELPSYEFKEILIKALESLSEIEREIILETGINEKTPKQERERLSNKYNASWAALRKKKSRAITKLRDYLKRLTNESKSV